MSERKLPNKRRKFSKGRVVRVSDLVYAELDARRQGRSWDRMLRAILGLPDRAGFTRPLVEGMLEVHSGVFILKLPDAEWTACEEIAFKMADISARKRRVNMQAPIKLKEWR